MAENGPSWEVTAQREEMQQGPSGAFEPGMVVTFRTESGATGSVWLRMADYTVEKARATIAARAAVMESVAGLTS